MSDNDDLLARFAAGEGEHGPPPPRLDDEGADAGANPDRDSDRTGPDGETETAANRADPGEPNLPGR